MRRFLLCFILGFPLFTVSGCNKQNPTEATPDAVPVTITTARLQSADAISLPGRVEAWRSAEVRARVSGIVVARHFEEGAEVKRGQKLFTIDPAPFEAELSERKAVAAKARAQLTEAQTALSRTQQLIASGAVSQQAVDSAKAAADSAHADVLAADAAIKTAALNLSYAHVTAPIDGRIGRALVTEGALVGHNESTPLALIQQIDKVYVNFTQAVAQSLHWQSQTAVPLQLRVEGFKQRFNGQLLFADISVDPTSDQITLRGAFDNPEHKLLPGMYVRVSPKNTAAALVVAPQRAIHHDHNQQAFLWLVNAENKAEQRLVTLGELVGQDWQILDGLAEGESIITGGNVESGSSVNVK